MDSYEKHKPSVPPDCPRQYHDDYIGRSARKVRGAVWLMAAAVLLMGCGAVYLLTSGGLS